MAGFAESRDKRDTTGRAGGRAGRMDLPYRTGREGRLGGETPKIRGAGKDGTVRERERSCKIKKGT